MKTEQKILTIGINNSSLMLRLTQQLKALGLKDGDKVFTYVENKAGERKIVIKKLEE